MKTSSSAPYAWPAGGGAFSWGYGAQDFQQKVAQDYITQNSVCLSFPSLSFLHFLTLFLPSSPSLPSLFFLLSPRETPSFLLLVLSLLTEGECLMLLLWQRIFLLFGIVRPLLVEGPLLLLLSGLECCL